MTLGRLFARARHMLRMNQTKLGEEIGCGQDRVSRIEVDRQVPTAAEYVRLQRLVLSRLGQDGDRLFNAWRVQLPGDRGAA